jgi:phage tail sheath protein FI
MTYGRPGVYVNEALLPAPVASIGGSSAAGAAIGAFEMGPTTLTLVTSWYDFAKKFGGFNAKFPATFGVNQFFVNGGTELYVKRVLSTSATAAEVNVPKSVGMGDVATITALNKGTSGNNLRVQITKVGTGSLYNLTVTQEVVTANLNTSDADSTNDIVVETFTNVVFDDPTSGDYVESVVNTSSFYIQIVVSDNEVAPETQSSTSVLPLTGGDDSTAPLAAEYAAVFTTGGTSELDLVLRPLVAFAPELYAKFVVDGSVGAAADLATVHDAMLAWADSGIGFAVLDTASGIDVATAIDYATARTASSQGAVYYPYYYVSDPLGRSRAATRKVGPAGAVAGLYMATDRQTGPFKTPAGIGTGIRSAVSLERAFTPAELDSLNTGVYVDGINTVYGTAVNAVRNIPGAGIVVMGGRTLKQDGTANRYINTRRSLIYIKKQLENITEFAVFENNDYKLWNRLRTVVSVFLNEYRNQGGLRGATPSEAYYVKVDAENNTPNTIQQGQVNIEVGVALEYPAEFVVINLSQISGQ